MDDSEELRAWIEICTLKARHLRLLDTKDWAGYAALLTEDYELDISEGTNIPVLRGRDAVVRQVQGQIRTATTVHQAHVPEFALHGDEAHIVWPMQDRMFRDPDKPSFSGYGHHHDRWVRLGGTWKLAAQKLTRLHIDVFPPVAAPAPSWDGQQA